MGIPSYFSYLIRRYPKILQGQRPEKIQRLFLDANGIVHTVAQKVMAQFEKDLLAKHPQKPYWEVEEFVKNRKESLYLDVELEIFREVTRSIMELHRQTLPHSLFYVCFDGVAPRAKMEQQRKRRHRSQRDTQLKTGIYHRFGRPGIQFLLWDSNCITPGTMFMKRLSHYLQGHLFFRLGEVESVVDLCISDTSVPGEGEHKIVRYIRANPQPEGVDVIYGLDADLMMLAMCCYPQPIYLLRERVLFDRKLFSEDILFIYLSITELVRSLLETLRKYGADIEEKNEFLWIKDYIFLCFLVGNDFIPHQESLAICEGDIDVLLKTLMRIRNHRFLQESPDLLCDLFGELSKNEDERVRDRYQSLLKLQPRKDGKNDPITEEIEKLNFIPNREAEKALRMGAPGWRERFYTATVGDLEQELCKNYLEGIMWTAHYYFEASCLSTSWHYQFPVAPTFLALVNYMKKNPSVALGPLPCKRHFTCEQQLALVLPFQSFPLLPRGVQRILAENQYQIFFPRRVALNLLGKRYSWEGWPVLPRMDEPRLEEMLDRIVRASIPCGDGDREMWFERDKTLC